MKAILMFVVISNCIATAIIFAIESSTSILGLHYWQDYAFFNVFILWGIAATLFMHPPQKTATTTSDKAERTSGSLIDHTTADEIDELRWDENVGLYTKFFIAGLPAIVICLMM